MCGVSPYGWHFHSTTDMVDFLVAGDKENDYNKWRIFVYRYGSMGHSAAGITFPRVSMG